MRIVACVCAICAVCGSAAAQPNDRLLDAIRQVESGGDCGLVGDGGKAIGPYQIHREYWQDAVAFDKRLGGTYEDCRSEAYARRVVRAYLTRYGKGASDEQMARIHNGGCGILRRVGTSAWNRTTTYWRKVQRAMRL